MGRRTVTLDNLTPGKRLIASGGRLLVRHDLSRARPPPTGRGKPVDPACGKRRKCASSGRDLLAGQGSDFGVS